MTLTVTFLEFGEYSMKVSFTTPVANADGTPVDQTEASALVYFVLIDTVNPPVKSYQVPAANIAAGTSNADGSKTVTVVAEKDLPGFTLGAPGTSYFVAAEDEYGTNMSAATGPVAYVVPFPTPSAPGNLSVS